MNRVEIDWHPAYELWLSSYTFKNRSTHKTLDLGMDWVRQVRSRTTPELRARIESGRDSADVILPLLKEFKGERNVESFLDWLAGLTAGELYEILQPWLHESRPASRLSLLSDLGGERDDLLTVLREWNDQYFTSVDSRVLEGLQTDAEEKRTLAKKLSPVEVVDLATGIDYSRVRDVQTVFLTPQFHANPWNVYERVKPGVFYLYPIDPMPVPPGEPSTALVRLTRALSDESRLKILRFLAAGPRRFIEIVDFLGISKSTTHHHILTLRAAKLIRLTCDPGWDAYALRPGALDEVSRVLAEYVNAEESAAVSASAGQELSPPSRKSKRSLQAAQRDK